METIKLFSFITISLIPTIVSSTKCENQEARCIELCCKVTQYYEDVSKKCTALPKTARILWETVLDDNNTMSEKISKAVDFVVLGECEASDDQFAVIPFCYSLYYQMDLEQFGARSFSDVPCDRLKEPAVSKAKIVSALYVGAMSICLSIMVIYTCIKGLKERFIFKLYSWYLVSMAVFVLAIAATSKVSVELLGHLKVVGTFAFMSTWLWLNVIGFHMWSGYKLGNTQDDSHTNKTRFICYSIYVWGVSAILTYNAIVNYNYEVDFRYYMKGGWLEDVVTIYNLFTFLLLSVNICITRCRVINLITETRFKRRLAIIILRLGLMMGFPRMVVVAWVIFFDTGMIVLAVLFTLEPFMMFIVLLWKPKNVLNWILISCCCRNSEEISNAPEV